mmetsp:Transcript_22308/g.62239  ORF Transcript_22308/g.62239 Transcript_22308/m.62239 type:complete len:310 (-) Transcript_22308:98-1027(-)
MTFRLPSQMRSAKTSSRNWSTILPIVVGFAMVITVLQFGRYTDNINQINNAATYAVPSSQQESRPKPPPLKTKATHCIRDLPEELYMSQREEDKLMLERWFTNLCGGTYIEMGGLDGQTLSNTYVFNKGLGWNGVLVEADPISYANLKKNRPNEIAAIHAGVCLQERDLHWVQVDINPPVSGFLEFAAKDFMEKWWPQRFIDNAMVVKCRRLDTLLHKAVGKSFHFDFFSLDVEGAELLALQSLNFDEYQFGVIFVEADGSNARKDQGIKTLLARAGYDFVGNIKRSTWFVNRNFDLIYSDVIHDNKKK